MKAPNPTPRAKVQRFAGLMEHKLRANAHKGGWRGEPTHWLLAALCDEMAELIEAVEWDQPMYAMRVIASHNLRTAAGVLRWFGPCGPRYTGARVAEECADVANFAMMIADVCGGLKAPDGVRTVASVGEEREAVAAKASER